MVPIPTFSFVRSCLLTSTQHISGLGSQNLNVDMRAIMSLLLVMVENKAFINSLRKGLKLGSGLVLLLVLTFCDFDGAVRGCGHYSSVGSRRSSGTIPQWLSLPRRWFA